MEIMDLIAPGGGGPKPQYACVDVELRAIWFYLVIHSVIVKRTVSAS